MIRPIPQRQYRYCGEVIESVTMPGIVTGLQSSLVHEGPSISETSSNPTTTSSQISNQGASGSNSPTLGVGSNSTLVYNDPVVQTETFQGLFDVVTAALTGAGELAVRSTSAVRDLGTANQASNADLIGQVLQNQATLASTTATGGYSEANKSTNLLIIAGVVLSAIALLLSFMKGRN